MNSYQVRVNMNHMKAAIEQDYMAAKDHLTRSTLASLAIVHCSSKPLHSITMEDHQYNLLYQHALSQPTLELAFTCLGLQTNLATALDIHSYIEEFILRHHNPTKTSYCLITIDSAYYLVITLKEFNTRDKQKPNHIY